MFLLQGMFYKFHAAVYYLFSGFSWRLFVFIQHSFFFTCQSHSTLCSFLEEEESAGLKFKKASKVIYRTRL